MNNNDPYSNGDYSANPYLSYQKFNKDYDYEDPEPPKSPVQILTGDEEKKKGISSLSSALVGGNPIPQQPERPEQNTNNMQYNNPYPNNQMPNQQYYNPQQQYPNYPNQQQYYQNPQMYNQQPNFQNMNNNQQYNPYNNFNNNNNQN